MADGPEGDSPAAGADSREAAADSVVAEASPVVGVDSAAGELQGVGRLGLDGYSMKDLVGRFISKEDRVKIEAGIREAETRTRGEIVVMVVPASYRYPMADLLGATAFSFPAAVALTPELGGFLWAGSWNLWIFLALLIPLFLVFQQVVKRVHVLKRWFISGKEMEDEVREAAHIQFFRKGLYRTREETGVLIYVSVFERRVWVLGDRGINAAIPEGHWNGVVATIVQAIKDRRPGEGICQAIGDVSRILQEKFPIRHDDQNELKNLMVEDVPS
jgi:putative membrane protein